MIKIVSPPCWGYQWKIPGVRVKVGGIPGGKHQKLGKKRGFSGGVNAKKMEIPGESGKIWLEIQRINFKKIDILNRGEDNFFLEAQL